MTGPRESERGGALLTVLLLVAIMSALSVAALEKLRLSTRLAANGAAADQARLYAIGAEAIAMDRISQLNSVTAGFASLTYGWSDQPFTLPLPGGIVTARLGDGGNCFNLNSVVEGLIVGDYAPRELGVRQFVWLMQALGIPPVDARRVAASLVDWIDADSAPNPDGAEDDYYTRSATPYRAANTLMSDVTELRAVAGVTPELYATLRPWICALPTTDLSPINVNTLGPDQAPLVAMLIPDQLDLPRARQILAQRPAGGWDSIASFWELSALQALTPPMEVQDQTKLQTRWFNLALDVEIGGAQVSETALIDGGLTPARLVSRKWGSDE